MILLVVPIANQIVICRSGAGKSLERHVAVLSQKS
jgi:hypothetical protein